MRKEGLVTYWNELKGFGFASVTRAERYYFHVSQIVAGPIGSLFGLTASFDVSTESTKTEGKLPQASNVRISEPAVKGGSNG